MINTIGKFAFGGMAVFAAIYPFIAEQKDRKLVTKSKQGQVEQTIVTSTAPEPVKPVAKKKDKPKIVNEYLPKFAEIRDVKAKKKAFFSYLKPFVVEVNAEIKQKRSFLLSINEFPTEKQELETFNQILKQFRVEKSDDFQQVKSKLLLRVDELPVELVLMQAANESAWGTSRFALLANNLFGQWCFRKGCGVIPEGRPEGKTYEVRKFNRPIDSIRSYFHNLNTGHAYTELRELRLSLRNLQEELDANIIAEGLTPYSIRREAYVEEIQNMIRINQKYI